LEAPDGFDSGRKRATKRRKSDGKRERRKSDGNTIFLSHPLSLILEG